MTETVTQTFCERCGTRYAFEPPRSGGLARLRAVSKGLREYVLTDHRSLGDAMTDARNSLESDASLRQLDAFQKMFSFCLGCRQYVCSECWNSDHGRCRTCAPMAGDEAAKMAPILAPDPTADAVDAAEDAGEPEAQPEPEPEAQPEPEPEAQPESEAAPEPEAQPEPEPEALAEAAPEAESEGVPDDVIAAAIAAGIILPTRRPANVPAEPAPAEPAVAPAEPAPAEPAATSAEPAATPAEPFAAPAEPAAVESVVVESVVVADAGLVSEAIAAEQPSEPIPAAVEPLGEIAGDDITRRLADLPSIGGRRLTRPTSPATMGPTAAAVFGALAAPAPDTNVRLETAAVVPVVEPMPPAPPPVPRVESSIAPTTIDRETGRPGFGADRQAGTFPSAPSPASTADSATHEIAPPAPQPAATTVPTHAAPSRPAGRPGVAPVRIAVAKACVGCGLQLAAAARFCRRCGARQDEGQPAV
jgi:hypothetical protein